MDPDERDKSMDELLVQVEYKEDLEETGRRQLRTFLEKELKKVLGVRAQVQMVESGTLERTQFKARRIVDQRGLYEEMMAKKA